jgi:VanZ family protein
VIALLRTHRLPLWILTGIAWATLLTLTHLPPTKLPQTHINDKIEHITAYGVLAALFYASLSVTRIRSGWVIAAIVISVLLAFGAFDELTQPYFQRTCDIHDWYGDATGTILATVIMSFWRSRAAKP